MDDTISRFSRLVMPRSEVQYPVYVSPSQFDHVDYVQAIKGSNTSLHRRVNRLLQTLLSEVDQQRFSILTTGSDARLEKGPYHSSHLEMIILEEEELDPLVEKAVIETIENFSEGGKGDLDIRKVGRDEMSYYMRDREKVFPTRIVDSVFLYGNRDLQSQAIQSLFEEFVGSEGQRISRHMGNRRRHHRSIVKSGGTQVYKGGELVHYEIDSNNAFSYFDPESEKSSFKIGPLRAVQYDIMLGIMNAFRGAEEDTRKTIFPFFRDLPRNTSERLYSMQSEGMLRLNNTEVRDLVNCYNYFVWAYNLAQEMYQNRGQVKLELPGNEVRERMDVITKLSVKSNKPLVKL